MSTQAPENYGHAGLSLRIWGPGGIGYFGAPQVGGPRGAPLSDGPVAGSPCLGVVVYSGRFWRSTVGNLWIIRSFLYNLSKILNLMKRTSSHWDLFSDTSFISPRRLVQTVQWFDRKKKVVKVTEKVLRYYLSLFGWTFPAMYQSPWKTHFDECFFIMMKAVFPQ